LIKETRKIISKKLIGQTYMKFDDCHGNIKKDGHTIGISDFPLGIKEQLLKVSAS